MPSRLIAFFGIFVAFSFLGHDMEELRSWDILQISERLREPDDIMSIDWSEIAKMERFKQVTILHEYSLESLFRVFEEFFCRRAEFSCLFKKFSYFTSYEIKCM